MKPAIRDNYRYLTMKKRTDAQLSQDAYKIVEYLAALNSTIENRVNSVKNLQASSR